MVPIAGCAAKASRHPLTSTLIRFSDEPSARRLQGQQASSAQEVKWWETIPSREGMEASAKASRRPTSLSQMRRAARRASAREAKGEAAAIAAAKRRLPLTRSTSSTESGVGVAISPAANSTALGGAGAGMRWPVGVLVGPRHRFREVVLLCPAHLFVWFFYRVFGFIK